MARIGTIVMVAADAQQPGEKADQHAQRVGENQALMYSIERLRGRSGFDDATSLRGSADGRLRRVAAVPEANNVARKSRRPQLSSAAGACAA